MMGRGRFYFLSAFTAILCVGLLFGPSVNHVNEVPATPSEELFPKLRQQLGSISSVRISDAKSTVTLSRLDQGWVVIERDLYPADEQMLHTMLKSMADAVRLEAKTRKQTNHAVLGVSEAALQLSLAGLPSLFFGNPASGRKGRYVRFEGDDQVWLQSALVPELTSEPRNWLRKQLVDIDSDDIRRVTLHHQGERLAVNRSSSGRIEVEGIAPEQYRYPEVANSLLNLFEGVMLLDVAKRGEINFLQASELTVVLKDDSQVKVLLSEHQGRYWLAMVGLNPSVSIKDVSLADWAFEISRLNYDNMTRTKSFLVSPPAP